MPAQSSNGQLDEAQREFEIALDRSRGKFDEARDNLARCRQMLSSKSSTLIAELKTIGGSGRISLAME